MNDNHWMYVKMYIKLFTFSMKFQHKQSAQYKSLYFCCFKDRVLVMHHKKNNQVRGRKNCIFSIYVKDLCCFSIYANISKHFQNTYKSDIFLLGLRLSRAKPKRRGGGVTSVCNATHELSSFFWTTIFPHELVKYEQTRKIVSTNYNSTVYYINSRSLYLPMKECFISK